MDRESFVETINTLQQRKPYHPFTVALINGQEVEIDRPESLHYRDRVAVFIAPGGKPWIFDHEGVSHIVADLADKKTEE